MSADVSSVQELAAGERFWRNLRCLGSVDMMQQLDDGLTSIVERVMQTGEPGRLTLVIAVSKSKMDRQVMVKPKVTVVTPQEVLQPRFAYADDRANLHDSDPMQPELKFAPEPVQFKTSAYEPVPFKKTQNK